MIGLALVMIPAAGAAQAGTWIVSGVVLRADTAGPAAGVQLDFRDLVSGEVIPTPGNVTNASGAYGVAVPLGIYEISFSGGGPPQLAPGHLLEISVDGTADVSLPAVTLGLGYHLSGRVVDAMLHPVGGAALELRIAGSNAVVFTRDAETSALGMFDVIVPAGTYDIEIDPPPVAPLAARLLAGVAVVANADLGTQQLVAGLAVQGTVADSAGHALREVELAVAGSASGLPVPAAHNHSDAAGAFVLQLPAGSYRITYHPLVDSRVDPFTSSPITVAGPITLSPVELPFHNEDNDSIVDVLDDCPFKTDPVQEDFDGDGVGSLCDNCPLASNPRQENNDHQGGGDACDPNDDNDAIPDFSDTDRDGDLVLNPSDNCPNARNAGQEDIDGNGVGDACDADDGQVEYLEARSRAIFVWRPESEPLGYEVYRQRLAWLSRINYGVCVRDAPGDASFLRDAETPQPGEGFTYLVTAEMATGEGSLGRRSDGAERPNLRPCPR